jgi:hypothetical protein
MEVAGAEIPGRPVERARLGSREAKKRDVLLAARLGVVDSTKNLYEGMVVLYNNMSAFRKLVYITNMGRAMCKRSNEASRFVRIGLHKNNVHTSCILHVFHHQRNKPCANLHILDLPSLQTIDSRGRQHPNQ